MTRDENDKILGMFQSEDRDTQRLALRLLGEYTMGEVVEFMIDPKQQDIFSIIGTNVLPSKSTFSLNTFRKLAIVSCIFSMDISAIRPKEKQNIHEVALAEYYLEAAENPDRKRDRDFETIMTISRVVPDFSDHLGIGTIKSKE